MKRGFFLKFSLLNVLNSPSERVFYFVRRKYASFSLNFSLFVLMICLFVPFPLSGPASFGQFACLDLAPCFVWPLPFLGDFFLWSFARVSSSFYIDSKKNNKFFTRHNGTNDLLGST